MNIQDDNNLPLIIGVAVGGGGGVLICLALIMTAIGLRRRQQRRRVKLQMPDFTKLMFSPSCIIVRLFLTFQVSIPPMTTEDEKTVIAHNMDVEMVSLKLLTY